MELIPCAASPDGWPTTPTPDGVLFGSEPKAILTNPLFESRSTDDGLFELLTNAKTPATGSSTACTR